MNGDEVWSRAWTYSKALIIVMLWALWMASTIGASLMLLYVGLVTLSRPLALLVASWPLLVHLTLWPTFVMRTQLFFFPIDKSKE